MNEQKLPSGWALVPVEPTAEIIAAAAVAAWPVAKLADIELARHAARHVLMEMDLGTSATEESLAAVLATMAPAYRAMIAAAPHAPSWSSATAPGPDGYQRTVAVPGMPSAARDAGLELAAQCLITRAEHHHRVRNYAMRNECLQSADSIRAHKSIVAPAPVQQAAPSETTYGHPDDSAVDRFATALKAKMASARAKGRSGWSDPAQCPVERLQAMLRDHITKGDPVDVGNFAMMLFNRGEQTTAAPAQPAIQVQQAAPSGVLAWEERLRLCPTSNEMILAMEAELADWRAYFSAAPAQPAGLSEQDKLDAARLDFVLDHQAFICTIPAGAHGAEGYQLMEQDEDEDFQVVSGEGIAYSSKREAIDAAILAAKAAP